MRITPLILVVLATAVAAPGECNAQAAAPELPPDTTALRIAADTAQLLFEDFRHEKLPAEFFQSGVGCAETIGRFCHWSDDDEQWSPEAEPEEVTAARAALIGTLDSIANLMPGNPWLTGLRVYYRIEQGELDAALAVARDCDAPDWWCGALEGYVLHAHGDITGAEEAFRDALAAMPYAQRCRWNDISSLLDRELQTEYGAIRCSQRVDLHAAVWELSDPLYLAPGNDRFTEHLSRLVVIEIMKSGPTPFRNEWGPDVREIVVRFGWPVAWVKNMTPGRDNQILSRGRPFSRSFIPPAGILSADSGATWQLNREFARTAYLPSYLQRIFDLDHQIAMFRRGDSAVVAAAYQVTQEMRGLRALEAALTVAEPGVDRRQIYNSEARPADSFLAVSVDSSLVVSLEVYSAPDSLAARARYPVERPQIQPGGIGISDILLFRPREPLPESVEEAVFLAHYHTRINPGEPLGLYWEVYGLANAGAGVTTDVTVIREGRGLFRGLFETVGLARPRNPEVRYEWVDGTGDVTAVYPRAVVVDLNDTEAGNYIVRVVATPENGAPAIAERRIEIIQND